MSYWNKEQLEDMLYDVVSELNLSDAMQEKHGPLGTAPAELVREVLAQKDLEIRMLKQGFKCIDPAPAPVSIREERYRKALGQIAAGQYGGPYALPIEIAETALRG